MCVLGNDGEGHTIAWDCRDLGGGQMPSGLYPYVYLLDGRIQQRRLLQVVE